MDRDLELKTNYYAFPEFDDGDPSTSVADYRGWTLSIDDTNDLNGNKIPDLSDDAPPAPEQGPTLTLARSANQLSLGIQGAVGKSYELQEAVALGATNWTRNSSITLTNTSQAVSLPVPATRTKFWRLKAL
jgi:hypothetical protein